MIVPVLHVIRQEVAAVANHAVEVAQEVVDDRGDLKVDPEQEVVVRVVQKAATSQRHVQEVVQDRDQSRVRKKHRHVNQGQDPALQQNQ